MTTLAKVFLASSAIILVVAGGALIAFGAWERQPAGVAIGIALAIGAYLVSP